jgi:hypothetical protein
MLLLIFKSQTKTGDYHGEINFDIFSWLRKQLLPNMLVNSVDVFAFKGMKDLTSAKKDTVI